MLDGNLWAVSLLHERTIYSNTRASSLQKVESQSGVRDHNSNHKRKIAMSDLLSDIFLIQLETYCRSL